jgi:predicted phage terminase large subunit-like protein
MDKVIEHFRLLFSILDPGGTIIVIGTRWHEGDLYDFICNELKDDFDIYIEKARRDDGTLFFPRVLSDAFLKTVRKIMGARIFACQYQNEVIADEDKLFKEISYYDELPKNLVYTIFLDPAISRDAKADFRAFTVVAHDYRHNMYVVAAIQNRDHPKAIIDQIFMLNRIYHPQVFAIEEIGFQQMLGHALRDEMQKRDEWVPVKAIKKHDATKRERIQALQPRIMVGSMMFKKGLTDLEDQMIRYPRVKHDDLLDSLAGHLDLHQEVVIDSAQTPEEEDREVERVLMRLTPSTYKIRRESHTDAMMGSEY